MAITDELLEQLIKAVRVKSSMAADEITDLAEACKKDLEIIVKPVPNLFKFVLFAA